jgi:plasmid stabilization system protein ParE
VLFTDSATRQADEIGAWSEERFGEAVRDRYDLLLAQAVIDLAEAPRRRGVEIIDGRIHYHIRHSLPSLLKADRVGTGRHLGRHLVIARVVGDALWVLAYAHDSMVDELDDRIRQGEGEVDRGL